MCMMLDATPQCGDRVVSGRTRDIPGGCSWTTGSVAQVRYGEEREEEEDGRSLFDLRSGQPLLPYSVAPGAAERVQKPKPSIHMRLLFNLRSIPHLCSASP